MTVSSDGISIPFKQPKRAKPSKKKYIFEIEPENKFCLDDTFLAEFHGRQPAWGYGALSEVVFRRTYARPVEGGGRAEEFWETLKRVVEGVFSVLKQRAMNVHCPWDDEEGQEKAQEMYRRMWGFKLLPPGRGLWGFGTEALQLKGSCLLNNCAFWSTKDVDKDFSQPFCDLADLSMLGCGVGFDLRGAGKVTIVSPERSNEVFVVEDSREGWVDALRAVLDAFAGRGALPRDFDFSRVRREGARLATFGGTASGPKPLEELLQSVIKLLTNNPGPIKGVTIVTIMNLIGKCVVSGNVRRSSEIAIGEASDAEFVGLKNPADLIRLSAEMAGVAKNDVRWAALEDQARDLVKAQEGLSVVSEEYAARQSEIDRLRAEQVRVLGQNVAWRNLKAQQEALPLISFLWASNNSVLCDDDTDYEALAKQTVTSGEPGYAWLDVMRTQGRSGEASPDPDVLGLNPCLTGDVKIALADGRGFVPIKQLSDEEEDVSVYTCNSEGRVAIRTMRHPRVTGKNVPVYEVVIEEGFSFKATGNHKMRLSDGSFKQVKDLQEGDSLHLAAIDHASIKDIFPAKTTNEQNYRWVRSSGMKLGKAEHKMIWSHAHGQTISTGEIIHHRDYDAQNNKPENLEKMTKEAHDDFHRADKVGDKNPMRRAKLEWSKEKWDAYRATMSKVQTGEGNARYSDVTHEQLYAAAKARTEEVGYRISDDEWRTYAAAHALPSQHSAWRVAALGMVNEMLYQAAKEVGVPYIDVDPRTVRVLRQMTAQGYEARIDEAEGYVLVVRVCEECGERFEINQLLREHSFCSRVCARRHNAKDDSIRARQFAAQRAAFDKKREQTNFNQLRVFSSLKAAINRVPLRKEWEAACKKEGIAFRLGTAHSYSGYKEVVERGLQFNHKVVSVKLVGNEDVYNGTVDEFHNFYFGGWISTNRFGKPSELMLNSQNCGEIPLNSGELCCLAETFPTHHDSLEDFKVTLKYAYLYAKVVTLIPTHNQQINAVISRNRRIGISMAGIFEMYESKGMKECIRWWDEGYRHLRALDKEYSRWLGVNSSIRLTTSKPGGTVPLLAGVEGGLKVPTAKFYFRTVRIAEDSPLVSSLTAAGYRVEKDRTTPRTVVAYFPCKTPEGVRTGDQVSLWEQAALYDCVARFWSDNAVSATLNFQPHEASDVAKVLRAYAGRWKAISFLPFSDFPYSQAPYIKVGKADYVSALSKVRPIETLSGNTHEAAAEDKYCSGGVCSMPVRQG